MTDPLLHDLLTVDEAADLLRVHPVTLRRWLRAGEFPGVKLRHGWRVRLEDIEQMIETPGRHLGGP